MKQLNGGQPIAENAFARSGWDVVAAASITVSQNEPQPYKWGANLWYTNLGTGGEYRWWEVMYFNVGLSRAREYSDYEPFALGVSTKDLQDADLAASNVSHVICTAADPRPADDEDVLRFCDRWAKLLAKACQGQLGHPSSLPIK